LRRIRLLQKTRIGRSNPRTQRLGEWEEARDTFIEAYNAVYDLIRMNDFNKIHNILEGINNETLQNISAILGALVSEDIIVPEIIVNGKEPKPFGQLAQVLIRLFADTKMTERNRFRRLVPVERISKLSSMIFALTSEEAYRNYKQRTFV
jgi:hypothetical protein